MGHSFNIDISGGNNQNQFGDGNTANQTINQQGAQIGWDDVEAAIAEEDAEAQAELRAAMEEAKALDQAIVDAGGVDDTMSAKLDTVIQTFGKYKKVAKVALTAMQYLPGIGGFAQAAIAVGFEIVK